MAYAFCSVPVSPLRAESSHRAEMVSQLVFGEACTIIERAKDNWVKVQCAYDKYEGWCQQYQLAEVPSIDANSTPFYAADWVNDLTYNGTLMKVPFGSSLHGLTANKLEWNGTKIEYNGDTIEPSKVIVNEKSIRQFAFTYLNTPYLWGGKTVFGVDCSGFCQTVFKLLNIHLHRDAYQQATQGEVVGFLQEAKCGDLAFFDNEEGRITHVGILLNDSEIIHASVKVRVDRIDNMGIINTDTNQRTHKLRVIKRYF